MGNVPFFDPHYFDKKRDDYSQKSISTLPRQEYLAFLENLFAFMKGQGKKTTRLAFINVDWRDFQNTPAAEETHDGGKNQVTPAHAGAQYLKELD